MLSDTRQRLQQAGRPMKGLLASDVLMWLSLMAGQVALPWWIAHEGGAPHLALYGAISALVAFVAMPLLSPLGDRYPKRWVITVGLTIFAVESILIAILASLGFYQIGVLIALECLGVIAITALTPASLSIVAELVPPEQLAHALGLQKSAQALGRMAGPVLGGAVLAAAGTASALWLHAGLLLAAAWLARQIPGSAVAGSGTRVHRWWHDLRAGLWAQWRIPVERGRNLVTFGVMICFAPAVGMLVPLKVQSLGLSAIWLGAAQAALALGLLAGALGGSVWVTQRVGRYWTCIGAIMVEGLALAAAGYTRSPWLMVAAFALTGFAWAAVQLVGQTHRTLAIPEEFRARMFGVGLMVVQVAAACGPALAGMALTQWPVSDVYVAFGLAEFACAFGFFFVRGFREFMALDHVAVKGWYGRRYPEAFANAVAQTPGRQR